MIIIYVDAPCWLFIAAFNQALFFPIFTKLKAPKTQYFDQTQGNLAKTQAKFPKIDPKYPIFFRNGQVFPQKARKRLKISLKTQGNLPKTRVYGGICDPGWAKKIGNKKACFQCMLLIQGYLWFTISCSYKLYSLVVHCADLAYTLINFLISLFCNPDTKSVFVKWL